MQNDLMHYGVKGMKWGVRKKRKESSGKSERRIKKAQKKFVKSVNRDWLNSYNKATDVFNSKVKNINDKYSDVNLNDKPTKRGSQYIREVGKLWTESYSNQLISDFGPEPINNGKEWVKRMPFMDTYDAILYDYERNK